MAQIKKPVIVEIHWTDSSGPYGMWLSPEDTKQAGVGQCKSVGYLFSKTKEYVKIVQSVTDYASGNLLIIPRCNVKKIRRLR